MQHPAQGLALPEKLETNSAAAIPATGRWILMSGEKYHLAQLPPTKSFSIPRSNKEPAMDTGDQFNWPGRLLVLPTPDWRL